ncbi:MAG: ABC transporter permease [Candidatus Methanomethylophilaceae archaeon]|nr:ABC transporter permease [Candidatus Methanomethylophilaceae archaeon]
MSNLSELTQYRCMIKSLVRRDLRGRYKGSLLGFLWNFITPFMQMAVYILVFSTIFRVGIEDYAIYLIVGLTPWILFSDSMTEGSGVMVANCELLKKIYFPRAVLPMALLLSKTVNFIIMLGIVLIIAVALGHPLNAEALLFIPVALLLLMCFILGLLLFLSSLNVFLRDIQYITTVVMLVLVWLTPIMYLWDSFDNGLLTFILDINPLSYFVELFHQILYWGEIPDLYYLGICTLAAFVSLGVGAFVFNKLQYKFAEVL